MPANADAIQLALGGLELQPFSIPGGSSPVMTATLREDPQSGARAMLVQFPAGWSRLAAGWYEVDEEVFVLEGHLRISGRVVTAGQWAFFPAGFVRTATETPGGALTLARFDGPPRWHEGEQP